MNNAVTRLEIDGNALAHNLKYFKNKLQANTKILAVVKAFGYGSDGVLVAKFLEDKVDYFAVAYTQEGIALREAGIRTPILVLHPQIQNLDNIITHCLEPNIYSETILHAFIKIANAHQQKHYPVHVKINTGLNRLGFRPKEMDAVATAVNATPAIQITSIFSHLAASEDANEKAFTEGQISSFRKAANDLTTQINNTPFLHLANTSGVVNYPEAHFDMVRVGIGLYGFGNDDTETAQLQNTHNLYSIISQIHTIAPAESVGYNRGFIAKEVTRSATIPIGHADGIPRSLKMGNGAVTINQQKAPILGNVCMDMIMVDVTHINCKEGDTVVIFNTQEQVQQFADAADTIVYETLTNISPRVKKMLMK